MPRNKHIAQRVPQGLSATEPANETDVDQDNSEQTMTQGLWTQGPPREIARVCFERLVRELAQNYEKDDNPWCFQKDVFPLLQSASEAFFVQLFKGAQEAADQHGRDMIRVQDLQSAYASAVVAAVDTIPPGMSQ